MNLFVSIQSIFKTILKICFSVVLIGCIIILSIYSLTTIYNFSQLAKFSGNQFYNPYESCGEQTFKANFHAHAVAWGNVTYGHNTDKQVFEEYTKRGYDIAGVSNYHSINEYGKNKAKIFIPVYEHGFNILKSHVLSINSKKVSYLDFPIFQNTSHQQQIIENLKENGDLTALAHPNFGGGRKLSDLRKLCHYDFLEVLNHYRISDKEWDSALSSGRLSWLLANDDTHDVRDETAFKIWNIIYSDKADANSILENMKKGKHYGVKTVDGFCTNHLEYCKVIGDSIFVSFTDTVEHFDVHGGSDTLEYYRHMQKDFAFKIKPTDDYLRIVAKNEKSWIFMNPIVRYDGKKLPTTNKLKPTINFSKTYIIRFVLLLFIIELLRVLFQIWKQKH